MAFQLVFAKQNYPESLEVTRQKKQGAKTRHKQKQQANKKKDSTNNFTILWELGTNI